MRAKDIVQIINEEEDLIKRFRNWAEEKANQSTSSMDYNYWWDEVHIRNCQLVTIERIMARIKE